MDFAELKEGTEEAEYFLAAAEKAFGILELNYKGRYESRDGYPGDLRLFDMKMRTTGFTSFGSIIATIRSMADKPVEMRGILWWFRSRFRRVRNFLFRNAMTAFLTDPSAGYPHLCGRTDQNPLESPEGI